MCYPPLVHYRTEEEYKKHYISKYCRSAISTFDSYKVSFDIDRFEHAFYKSSKRNKEKDCFSLERAERIDWIQHTLQDPTSVLRIGYDNTRKRNDSSYRVAVVMGNYVVIMRFVNLPKRKAKFVTAFIAEPEPLAKILSNPEWK